MNEWDVISNAYKDQLRRNFRYTTYDDLSKIRDWETGEEKSHMDLMTSDKSSDLMKGIVYELS
ncbi:hypothetical protein PRBEI_2000044500 [Prionailurus iriomotensis]